MPLVFWERVDGANADAIARPGAEDTGVEVAVFNTKIDAVVTNFGSVAAVGDDDGAFFAKGVLDPKGDGEGVVAILEEVVGDAGSSKPLS